MLRRRRGECKRRYGFLFFCRKGWEKFFPREVTCNDACLSLYTHPETSHCHIHQSYPRLLLNPWQWISHTLRNFHLYTTFNVKPNPFRQQPSLKYTSGKRIWSFGFFPSRFFLLTHQLIAMCVKITNEIKVRINVSYSSTVIPGNCSFIPKHYLYIILFAIIHCDVINIITWGTYI